MPATAIDFLRDLRIDEIVEDAQDVRVLSPRLTFLNRLNQVPADNRMLLAKNQKRVQIAPMIATDAKAPVFKAQRFTLESNTLGKIKFGTNWGEEEMLELLDLANSNIRDPQGILSGNVIRNTIMEHLEMIDLQKEWLAVAMALDGKLGSADYKRFGYVLEGVTWGRYDDLKITPSIAWEANPTTAKPITDIINARQVRSERFGKETNRITLPTAALRALIATTEFSDKVRMLLAPNVSYTNIVQNDIPYQTNLVGAVLGMQVVLSDGRYWNEDDSGTWTTTRFLPLTPTCPVILDDSNDDRSNMIQDFGVGMPMEGRLAELIPGGAGRMIGGPSGPANRVVSYAYIPEAMDPVAMTLFSTTRCFPRLYDRASNAVLYVGPITETIPVTDLSPV